jgi:sulfur carrier protein
MVEGTVGSTKRPFEIPDATTRSRPHDGKRERMRVTLEVVGGDTHEFEVGEETYADLLSEVGLSPHEVSVMVDGRPVPEDQPVAAEHVRVLRIVQGG